MRTHLRRFIGCDGGSYAIIAAIILPMLAGVAGGAVDFYIYNDQQKQLQNVADSATLAAAREALLQGWSQDTAEAVVDGFITANLKSFGAGSVVYTSKVEVDEAERRVSVTIDQDHYGYFIAGYFRGSPQIQVNAVAQASGSTNICVIGLDRDASSAIELREEAQLSSPNCAVYSNATDTKGLRSREDARLTANLACSAGGYEGASKNFNKEPLTDCPVMTDPLAARQPPKLKPCAPKLLTDLLGIVPLIHLKPDWTYCGGLTIKGNTQVVFLPGVHAFKDGPLIVRDNAKVDGLGGVGLYFTGKNAYFEFTTNANVDLQAPDSGPMAGLLVYQDRKSEVQNFKITSDFTRNLIGTIYLPMGNLVVDANNEVAQDSAYTALVVRQLILRRSPNLVLNTDYGDTTAPVPDGLGPSSDLRLVR